MLGVCGKGGIRGSQKIEQRTGVINGKYFTPAATDLLNGVVVFG